MDAVTVLAPAKLNLTLGVTGFAENGYHTLDMLMQAVSLYEKVEVRKSAGLRLSLPGSRVPADGRNTAVKAALAFSMRQACWPVQTSPYTSVCRCAPVWRAAVRMPPPFWWG